MDDEEFTTFFISVEEEAVSRRFHRADPIVLGLNLLTGMARAAYETFEMATNLVASHVNWEFDRDNFQQEAALEIESLVSGGYEEDEEVEED